MKTAQMDCKLTCVGKNERLLYTHKYDAERPCTCQWLSTK